MMPLSLEAQILLAAQYAELKTQTEELAAQMEQIKNLLVDANPEGATLGDRKLIKVKGRVNYTKLEKAYPQETNPDLYVTSVALDKKKIETELAPAVLEEYRSSPTYQIR